MGVRGLDHARMCMFLNFEYVGGILVLQFHSAAIL